VGVIFKSLNYSTLTITTGEKEERYIKLAEFPFDSTRKCMSVIVRDCVSKAVTIYTKGADNVMLEKIIFSENSIKEGVVSDLYKYSCEGYRTLVIASKKLNESEYRGFETVYK
jgi:phospholipid-translocating ATPase